MEKTKAIDLVMKCLAMADSATYNPNEADNALRKARELCEAHGLEFAQMEATRQNRKPEEIKYEVTKGHFEKEFASWEKTIPHLCNVLFETKCYWMIGGNIRNRLASSIVFVGTPQDVQLSIAVMPIIINLAKRYARSEYGTGWGPFHTSFCRGFISELQNKANREKAKAKAKAPAVPGKSSCTALVVVNKETQVVKAFDDMTKGFSTCRSRRFSAMDSAYQNGMERGRETNLNFHNAIQGVN